MNDDELTGIDDRLRSYSRMPNMLLSIGALAGMATHDIPRLVAEVRRRRRPARLVDSVDELDSLPGESVVRTQDGAVYERGAVWGHWYAIADDSELYSSDIALPATVLHEGDVFIDQEVT